MLIPRPTVRIVATLLTKNEEDIIRHNIEHHLLHGVSQIIATDNGSTDRTKQILAEYKEVVEIIDEPGNDHNQSAWVTRMARIACKLKPDWIIHLDADEFWLGLEALRNIPGRVAGCQRVYLHPPATDGFNPMEMRYYLDFDDLDFPQETKIAHRPEPEIEITHGNHGIRNTWEVAFTKSIYRHHYPIRSLSQWERKAKGHLSLMNRNSPCARWQKWYDLLNQGRLSEEYKQIVQAWRDMIRRPNHKSFCTLLPFWATDEIVEFFQNHPEMLPKIGEWQ